MITIETERLILRQWQESDLAPFAQMNGDADVMRYFPYIMTPQESDAMVAGINQHWQRNRFGLFAVERKDTGRFIGMIGLDRPRFEAHFTPCFEIGWRLAPAHWQQGFATEGAKAVMRLAFQAMKLPRLVSFTAAQNMPSRGVMRSIGLRHDPKDDFDHPKLAPGHPLRAHVLYQLNREDYVP